LAWPHVCPLDESTLSGEQALKEDLAKMTGPIHHFHVPVNCSFLFRTIDVFDDQVCFNAWVKKFQERRK
jgi:hypothetical protein